MKKLFYLLLMFALAGVWACDSSSGSSGGGVIPNSITIQGENLLYVDNTTQLKAVLYPDNFTSEEVVWSVDNKSVGTIDSTGLFTAKAEGTTNITASAGGVTSAPFNITVTIPVESVVVSDVKSPKEINVGQSAEFFFEVQPNGAKYKSVTWNVDNTTIANINKDTGVLIGHAPGTVNVTVTVDEVTSKPYPVKVILPLESVTINGPDSVMAQETANYTVVIKPENSSVTNITWSVDNQNLASIDANTGVLTAKADVGQVTVTVDVDGNTANKLVNIIKTLEIKGNNTTAVGGQITLTPRFSLTNNLTWKSSNPAVATVENGVVKGVSAGSTDITVSENENTSAAFTVTIVEMPAEGYKIVDGVYHVYSVAGFKKWVEAVAAEGTNAYTSCYLYSDLDFSGETTDILINKSYKGTFNGNGHIIKNYTISNGRGFIRSVASKGQVLNVTFDNANVTYTTEAGSWTTSAGIVAYSATSSSIENVHIKNSKLTVNSNDNDNSVAMIVAESTEATIKNCTVTDSTITVTGKMHATGGIVGKSTNNTVISGCFVNNLTISVQGSNYNTSGTGGIVGQQQDQSTVSDTVIGCGVANTTITSTGTKGRVGGLIGAGGRKLIASYFYGSVSNGNSSVALDFGIFNGTASTLFAKQKGGSTGAINGANSTTLVDDTTVTWAQAVEQMNQALTDNGYTDFVYRYDSALGYPVIEYAK